VTLREVTLAASLPAGHLLPTLQHTVELCPCAAEKHLNFLTCLGNFVKTQWTVIERKNIILWQLIKFLFKSLRKILFGCHGENIAFPGRGRCEFELVSVPS
jgi:hypothetical protein